MRIVRAHGEIAELIFSCTRTVLLLCWLQQARHRPADAGLRSRRLSAGAGGHIPHRGTAGLSELICSLIGDRGVAEEQHVSDEACDVAVRCAANPGRVGPVAPAAIESDQVRAGFRVGQLCVCCVTENEGIEPGRPSLSHAES